MREKIKIKNEENGVIYSKISNTFLKLTIIFFFSNLGQTLDFRRRICVLKSERERERERGLARQRRE